MSSRTGLLVGCIVFAILASVPLSIVTASDFNGEIGTFTVTTTDGTAVLKWGKPSTQHSMKRHHLRRSSGFKSWPGRIHIIAGSRG
jgi:hypothetical protein